MKINNKIFLYIAWVIALVSMLGSLYFSDVLKYAPCVLCWYQRIPMYPLVLIIPIGIVSHDKKLYQYVLPLSIIGFLIALYHNLLYYHVINETFSPCTAGVSCVTRFFEFGFISIPLLSLVAFASISICMLLSKKLQKNL